MFELRDFIINTIKSMLGNEAEYKVRKYASGWFEKDVLTLEDLQMIDDYYNPVPSVDELVEEVLTPKEM